MAVTPSDIIQDSRTAALARRADADRPSVRQGGATPPAQRCGSPDPVDARFYSLIWQPAAIMQEAWWHALALEAWQLAYARVPRCRRWVNQRIASQRGFPVQQVPYQLNPLERQLLSVSEKLPTLLLALGLLRLPQPEYRLLKPYRKAVQDHLNEFAWAQLAVISATPAPVGFPLNAPLIEPAQLADVAMRAGAAVLASILADSAALRAVEILLAPGCLEGERLAEPAAWFGWETLFRLVRFL